MRHSSETIKLIYKLVKEDYSLSKIYIKLNLPKTTVYYYLKKIKGKKDHGLEIIDNKEKIGEIIGAFAGDGTCHTDKKGYYAITYTTYIKEPLYASRLKSLLEETYNCKVYEYIYAPAIITRIKRKQSSEHIKSFLQWKPFQKTKTVCLKETVNFQSNDFLRGFIRGLIDTDGTIDQYGRISCLSISKSLMQNLFDAFKKFNFKPKWWIKKKNLKNTKYCIAISKKEAPKYLNAIGFGNKYKEEKLKKIIAPVV